MLLNAMKTLRAGLGTNRNFLLMTRWFASQKQPSVTDTEAEVKHHAKYADDWWNVNGSMSPLHALNEIRVPFIRDGIVARGNVDKTLIRTTNVLRQQKILEVGCGGGVLTEQIARLGASVTGIDLGKEVIEAAIEHLETHSSELKDLIEYKVEDIAVHAKEHTEHYDAIVISEVIEHVDEKAAFLTNCVNALKPGGSIFITAPNKTIPMWIGGIIICEYIINIIPKGTHHWDKLISPVDLQRILDTLNCQTTLVNGGTYEFWSNTWKWTNSTTMWYALQAIKNENNGK